MRNNTDLYLMGKRLSTILKKNYILFLFITILLIGGFLRFYKLGERSFWNDEVVAYSIAKSNTVKEVVEESYNVSWMPLDQIIIHFFLKLGDDEFYARLHAVLFGILSILILYFLAEFLFDYKLALLAALLLAINTFAIRYSQEARVYSSLLFFTLGNSFLFFTILLKRKYTVVLYLLLLLTGIIIVYLSHFGISVLVIQIICLVYYSLKNPHISKRHFNWKQYALSHFPMFIYFATVFLFFLFIYLKNLSGRIEHFNLGESPGFWPPLLVTLSAIFSYNVEGLLLRNYLAVALFVTVLALGILNKRSNKDYVIIYVLTILPPIILMNLNRHWFAERYCYITLPYVVILLSLGIDYVFQKRRLFAFIMLFLVIGNFTFFNITYFRLFQHVNPWEDAAEKLEAATDNNSIIFYLDPPITDKDTILRYPFHTIAEITTPSKFRCRIAYLYDFYLTKYLSSRTVVTGTKETIEDLKTVSHLSQKRVSIYLVQPLGRELKAEITYKKGNFSLLYDGTDYLLLTKQYPVFDLKSALEDIILSNPSTPWIYTLLADIVTKANNLEYAEQLYKKTIEIEPANVLNNLLIGRFYLQKINDPKKALTYFKGAVKLVETKEALVNLEQQKWAYTELGRAYRLIGNHEQAIIALDKALQIKGENEWAFTELAQVYQAKKDYEKAIETFRKAIASSKKPQSSSYILLARCLWKANKKEEALNILRRAINIFPESKEALSEYRKYHDIFKNQAQDFDY